MFAFPQIVSLFASNTYGVGTLEWPWLGTLLALLVLVTLVGTTLGLLQEQSYGATRSRNARVGALREALVVEDGESLQPA
jgi:hypothetical protein